ncbi:hypothetical protein MHYP_G00358670 [Metynnis hypsauchen]
MSKYGHARDVITGTPGYIKAHTAQEAHFAFDSSSEWSAVAVLLLVLFCTDFSPFKKKNQITGILFLGSPEMEMMLGYRDGSQTVCGPAGRKDSGSFFPQIWEKEQKKNPPMKPRPTNFPRLPLKREAGSSFVCGGTAISTGPPVDAVLKTPQSIFAEAAALGHRRQARTPDFIVEGVAVPLMERYSPAGGKDMKITPPFPPSPVLQPSPPPQPCPHRTRQRAAPASRPGVQIKPQWTFRPMPYTWSKWSSRGPLLSIGMMRTP